MELKTFFTEQSKGALAFSGGVDSAFLLWAAARYGIDWRAYYVRSAFQPAFELTDAMHLAEECKLPLTVIDLDVLGYSEVAANPADRCYHCKKAIFSQILCQASADGYTLVIDGSNASDDEGDRPSMRALRELEVRSPLRECGLTKARVRQLSREAGLFTWSKPAYACLATRIPTDTPLTVAVLQNVEAGENALMSMGFSDFRLRIQGEAAVLQFTPAQLDKAWSCREMLQAQLSPLFSPVSIDLKARQPSL